MKSIKASAQSCRILDIWNLYIKKMKTPLDCKGEDEFISYKL